MKKTLFSIIGILTITGDLTIAGQRASVEPSQGCSRSPAVLKKTAMQSAVDGRCSWRVGARRGASLRSVEVNGCAMDQRGQVPAPVAVVD
jgi:hypothetical protein